MIETYVIHVTKECNCACVYCYEQDKTSRYEWEEIKYLLDQILEYAPKEFGIEFLGGEPMLRFDLIKKVIDYVPQAQQFGITTNGTVYHPDLADLMKSNPKVNWSVSIDGHPIANMLRVDKAGNNTHDAVLLNYMQLKEAGVDGDQLSYHITAHPYNVGYLSSSIKYLYNIGLRHGAAGIVESTMGIDDDFFRRYEEEMREVSRMIYDDYPDMRIHELNSLKPKEDVRHYIRDTSGKVVGESYGRGGDDITKQNVEGLTPTAASGPMSERIYEVRERVYLYHNRRGRYYGVGTGRNGSKTLAQFLGQALETALPVVHEPMPGIPWKFSEEELAKIVDSNSHIVCSSLLNYAEQLIRNFDANFICVRRDKEEFILSFLRAHSLVPNQPWSEVQNRHQFPEYPEGTKMIDGLGLYWDDYYTKAKNLASKYEERFQIIEFEDFINRDKVQSMRQPDGDYQSRLCACRKREAKN